VKQRAEKASGIRPKAKSSDSPGPAGPVSGACCGFTQASASSASSNGGTQRCQLQQRRAFADVEVRTDDDRMTRSTLCLQPRQHGQCRGVAGLDRVPVLLAHATQGAQFGFACDQRLRGQHHGLALRRQIVGQCEPDFEALAA